MSTVTAVDTEKLATWIKAMDRVLEDKYMPVFTRVEIRKARSEMVSALGHDPRIPVW